MGGRGRVSGVGLAPHPGRVVILLVTSYCSNRVNLAAELPMNLVRLCPTIGKQLSSLTVGIVFPRISQELNKAVLVSNMPYLDDDKLTFT